MILKWGSYAHAQDEVGIRIHRRVIRDTFGRRMGAVHDWHIIGAVHGTSQADLTTKLAALEAAYDDDYLDLILFLNDGSTETAHKLVTANTFGGTHKTGFGYMDGPWKMQLEYANRRTFWITVRAEFRTGTGTYAWKERVRIKGTGGEKFRYMPRLIGVPIAQTLQTATSFYYIQEGSAIGRQAFIVPPGPLYPSIEHEDEREIGYYTPEDLKWDGTALDKEMYLTTWRYVMEATTDQNFSAFVVPNP